MEIKREWTDSEQRQAADHLRTMQDRVGRMQGHDHDVALLFELHGELVDASEALRQLLQLTWDGDS